MEIKIIKIDGEFVVVELVDGRQKICPIEIFPRELKRGDIIIIAIKVRE